MSFNLHIFRFLRSLDLDLSKPTSIVYMDIRRFISQKRPHEDTPSEMDIDKGASEELSQLSSGSHSPPSSQNPGIAAMDDLLPIPPHSIMHKLHLVSR